MSATPQILNKFPREVESIECIVNKLKEIYDDKGIEITRSYYDLSERDKLDLQLFGRTFFTSKFLSAEVRASTQEGRFFAVCHTFAWGAPNIERYIKEINKYFGFSDKG